MNSRYDELEILISKFTRQLPNNPAYAQRLEEELEIIANLNFAKHFLRVREILDLTRDIPHITRGSAGSSLLCWLMGISDVDPIAERIPLSRFMNPKRDDLPDIDLDFPHWQQETVMNRIFKRWPGQSARVSNYVMYKEKSARREAAKRMGIPQPKVSAMMHGDFSNLSERKLMDCLNRLGYDIEIKVRPTAEPLGQLTLATV